ncbi:MAG: hypothetical protein AB8H79_18125 [Myxococcota bacterium]
MFRSLVWISLVAGCAAAPEPMEARSITLSISQPEYGAFLGDGPVQVVGQVSEPTAVVLIDGVAVPVAHDGSFATTLEFSGDYEVVDVRAGGEGLIDARERVPVFAGRAPIDTFVDGMPGRFTNEGLLRLGGVIGAQVDATGWPEQLLAALPEVDTNVAKLVPREVTHSPTQVVVKGVEDGLEVGIELRDVTIVTDATFEVLGFERKAQLDISYKTVLLTALTEPVIRDDGIVVLNATSTTIEFADPEFRIDGNPLGALSFLADVAAALLEPAGEFLADLLLGAVGEIELGGPFEFQTELGESTLDIGLHDLYGDPQGLGILMAVGINEPRPEEPYALTGPSPSTRVSQPVHLVVGLHEYVFDGLLGDQVSSALGDDLDLGAFQSVVGKLVGDLPGGQFAPEGDWCIALEPGPAQVVRLHDGIEPMGHLYLPDVDVEFGVDEGSGCKTWLKTNLAMEIGIVPDGTEIGVAIEVGEAAVLQYESIPAAWNEDEVVAGMKELITKLAGVAAGQLSFDLAELLGGDGTGEDGGALGALGPLEPQILDSEPISDLEGAQIEGMYAISVNLWPEP